MMRTGLVVIFSASLFSSGCDRQATNTTAKPNSSVEQPGDTRNRSVFELTQAVNAEEELFRLWESSDDLGNRVEVLSQQNPVPDECFALVAELDRLAAQIEESTRVIERLPWNSVAGVSETQLRDERRQLSQQIDQLAIRMQGAGQQRRIVTAVSMNAAIKRREKRIQLIDSAIRR